MNAAHDEAVEGQWQELFPRQAGERQQAQGDQYEPHGHEQQRREFLQAQLSDDEIAAPDRRNQNRKRDIEGSHSATPAAAVGLSVKADRVRTECDRRPR